MIVIDASIVAPMLLEDEPPLPAVIATRLSAGPLIAPVHWPLETANMLHMATRRRRIDRITRDAAMGYAAALGVMIVSNTGDNAWGTISHLADEHGLTIYDAAYLDLAIRRTAALATLDGRLVDAARVRAIDVITY